MSSWTCECGATSEARPPYRIRHELGCARVAKEAVFLGWFRPQTFGLDFTVEPVGGAAPTPTVSQADAPSGSMVSAETLLDLEKRGLVTHTAPTPASQRHVDEPSDIRVPAELEGKSLRTPASESHGTGTCCIVHGVRCTAASTCDCCRVRGTPVSEGPETWWLIESGQSPPTWWTGRSASTGWTRDANRAARFATEADATYAADLVDKSGPKKVAEHVFLRGTPASEEDADVARLRRLAESVRRAAKAPESQGGE